MEFRTTGRLRIHSDRRHTMAAAGEFFTQLVPRPHFNAEIREHDDGFSVFADARPRLFRIAYRILGCAAAADDIVQDVWVRWRSRNRSLVENRRAFLATTTTRW